MEFKKITIEQLGEYAMAAFYDDNDIVPMYDKRVGVKSWQDAALNVLSKIKDKYSDADFYGVELSGEMIGYFVKKDALLISFCLQKQYRDADNLKTLWSKIISEIGQPFNCVLYSNNTRAINWLKKCGMEAVLDDVTIFYYDNKNYNLCQQ